MGDVVFEAPNFSGKANPIHMPVEEPGMFEAGIINKRIKSETETLAAPENGSTLASNCQAQEEKYETIASTLPTSSVESAHGASSGEILSPLKEDVKVAENDSSSCRSWAEAADLEHAEADTACELRGNTAGIVGEDSELRREDPLTISSEEIFNPTLNLISEESNKCSLASLHFPIGNNTGHSLETILPHPSESVSDQASEALGSFTSNGANEALSFADFSECQLPTQDTSTAVVVSTDLDGWQRFDAEESTSNGVLGGEKTIDEASQKRLELWEQLLEDGSEGSAQCTPMSTAPVKAEAGIDSSIYDGNQFWLASPGNPFIEGLERSSNFSEADGFITDASFVRSLSLHDYGVDTSFNKGLIQSDAAGKELYSGSIDKDKLAEDNLDNHFNDKCSDGSKKVAQQRFPSFSDIRRSSSRPRDTSFLSFKEQEPALNAHGFEVDEEKWEANFDSVAPTIHEGPRSLSLPREVGDSRREGSFEAPVTSHSKLSGFFSPKLSPIVKKVAKKVRTTPGQVLNGVHQGKGPKAVDKKESRKWTWRSCICCSHGS